MGVFSFRFERSAPDVTDQHLVGPLGSALTSAHGAMSSYAQPSVGTPGQNQGFRPGMGNTRRSGLSTYSIIYVWVWLTLVMLMCLTKRALGIPAPD